MQPKSIDGVITTPLRRIPVAGGDVLHALKASEPEFVGFGEAYFTTIEKGFVKGWKRHRTMVMNLVVVVGHVRFVLFDDRPGQPRQTVAVDLSPEAAERYARLTVPPGVWMAFTGVGADVNVVLNIASIMHDPGESENCQLDRINWDWDA